MKTRKTTILLAVFMVLGLILNAGAMLAQNDLPDATKDTTDVPTSAKEVVFLIDRSMYSKILADVKNQVTALSSELIKSGDVSITLIAFNGNANTLAKKTNDVEKIENAFRYITPFGFSNPTLALEIANSIEFAETKDIVLFTSIYPNIGSVTNDGPYAQKDHFYFRNGNSYKKAFDSLAENTRLITVSNLSALKNRDYGFAKRVFEENSDRYFESEKMNEIELVDSMKEFILGDEVHEINTDKKPIVFVPGIAGSELFNIEPGFVSDEERATGMLGRHNEKNMKRVWAPIGYDPKKITDDLNLQKNENVYGLQQGDLRNVPLFERHSGPAALYGSLLGSLMRNFPDRPVYLFSYDWRKSNVETAQKFANFVDEITDGGKVQIDIVAHSMGGIVSALYLKDNDERVDKFLSFGTPYEGAPSSQYSVSNSTLMGEIVDRIIETTTGLDTSIISDYDSMVELFPTQKLLEKYPMQFVGENEAEFANAIKAKNRNYDELLDRLEGENLSISMNLEEQDLALDRISQDERYRNYIDFTSIYREGGTRDGNVMLMYRPNSMFFFGNNLPTVVSGYFTSENSKIENIMTPEGDGVVPAYSATMGMTFDEMSPEIRAKFKEIKGDHVGMLLDLGNLRAMCDFLNGRTVR